LRFFYSTVLILFASFAWGQNYSISTIAGSGLTLGDGGAATAAKFGAVSAVAAGRDGSLYIADPIFHQVRKVTPNGQISIFAGGPVRGFGGDGGFATSAMLDTPTALVVTASGTVFIGDSGNHRVRAVTPYGFIQTVAGNGQVPASPSAAPVYAGEGGAATSAPLNTIAGLGFDSNGSLLIADSGNNRIFRVSGTGLITTVAGNATTAAAPADQPALAATLLTPTGVAGDVFGNVYFSELMTGTVWKIDSTGKMTRLIGAGSTMGYPLTAPLGLGSDNAYNLYIIEPRRVSLYTMPTPINPVASIQPIAGDPTQTVTSGTGDGGPPLAAGMNPRSVAAGTNGTLYIADSMQTASFSNRVRVILNNVINTFAGGNVPTGKGDKGPATAAELYFPQGIAVDPKGTVYIADTGDNKVRAVGTDGNINATAAINTPDGLGIDTNGNLYVTDGKLVWQVSAAGAASTFAGGGTSTQEGVPPQSALLTQAGSVAVDGQNDVFVNQLARVSEISSSTQLMNTVAGNGAAGYSGDNGPATAAQIGVAAGVAADSSGNLYIADGASGRIRKVDSTGNITTVAGGGTSKADGVSATTAALNNPVAVAVDGAGNLYIAEYGGNRIRMVNAAAGTIQTIAGNGTQGFSGDHAVATNASLNGPADVKVDGQGNVYIADSMNSSIRKLTLLTVLPTPAISGIVNGASFLNGPVAPGERVAISGTDLGPNSTVMFDSFAAPVVSSSFTSTTAVVPYEVSGQTTSQVTVTTNGVTSAAFQVQIAASAPGIFTLTGIGQGPAYAYGGDGNYNSHDNPAVAGTDVWILCTGEGLENPALATGVPVGQSPPSPVLPVTAAVAGQMAQVDGAYAVPGTIGLFLVGVLIPDNAITGDGVSVVIQVGNALSQNSAYISVQSGSNSGDDSGSDIRRLKIPPIRLPF